MDYIIKLLITLERILKTNINVNYTVLCLDFVDNKLLTVDKRSLNI